MRSSDGRLRGRDREVAVLKEALETVRDGRGACVVVEGAPGVGKTRLLEEVDRRARKSGFEVISVGADEFDQYAAGAALPGARAGTGIGDQRLVLLDGVTDALEERAQRAPVAVLVDDAQWVDPATLFALRTLPGRLGAARVLWVLAIRSEAERPTVARLRADLERFRVRWLTLGPLSADDLRRIAADTLGAEPAPGLARLLRGVGGNPFLAIELARACADGGGSDGVPAGFRLSVAERLDRLPEDALRLLQIGSVLGREFDLGPAARLLGRPVGSLLPGVEVAVKAGLLTAGGPRLAFRHDLIRQAVHDHLPPAVRTALHREAAELLRDLGARPAEAAWHVVLSGGPVDDAAVRTLSTAVRELASSAPDAAADLARRVADLLPRPDPRRIALLTEAAGYLGRTRQVHEALDLVDTALDEGLEPGQEAELRLVAAEIHQAEGDDAAAMTQLRGALALPGLPSELRVHLAKTKATGHLYLGEITAAEETDTGLVAAALRSEDPDVVVSAMVFQSQTAFYRGRLARALELAEAAETRAGTGVVHLRPPRIPALWLAMVLTATDRLADAARVLRDGQREAEAIGLGWSLPHWHGARASALLEQGALDDAAVEAEAGLVVADELELTYPSSRARAILALVELHRGDLTKARDHLRAAGSDAQRYGGWVALARACLADADGTAVPSAAFASPEPARLLTLAPSYWPVLTRAALRGGARPAAQAVSDAVHRLTDRDDSQRIMHAVQSHVDGLLDADPDLLASALADYRATGRPLALAGACEDLGDLLAPSADAIPHLEEAATLTAAAGARRDHDRLRRRLRHLGVRTPAAGPRAAGTAWSALTESERKLIPLVADGLTNRAIADQLFLSVHTVNTHLKHIFAKLGVTSRVELTRLALGPDGFPG